MAAVLVSLEQAKGHLRITTPDGHPDDEDIQLKLDQAEAIIRDYIKKADDPAWTAETAPPMIGAAILLMLGELYEHRGDLQENNADLWRSIDLMLAHYNTPAIG